MEKLLNADQAAELLGVSAKTLQNWRIKGTGPQYIQNTPRGGVRYAPSALMEWQRNHIRLSTSQAHQ